MKKISFDFDNTIAMGYMDFSEEPQKPVFQSYNDKIVKKIKKHIKNGDDIYIVTARTKELEDLPEFSDQKVEYHLEKLGLKDYFWPDKVIYTAAAPKYEILNDLGVEKHYDDSIEEHFDGLEMEYKVIQPLDDYKDSDSVGKVVIYDKSGRILVLQRSDEGQLWDLPGGHVKNIEIARGEQGLEDGTEREVFEETGLLVDFLKEFMVYDFVHRGIAHKIHMYLSQVNAITPDIRLDLQDHVENIDFRWVTLANLEGYMGRTTTNLRKAYDELITKDEILSETEVYQLKMAKNHREKKKKLIGYGKNKHPGGGKGHSKPNYSRSKSAPPLGETIGDEKWPKKYFREIKLVENDEKSKKKVKIKIKTVQDLEEKRKKRKKKRKKRKKTTRKRGYGGYYPYHDLYDSGNTGDSGGDGGGE
jgi:ADP-ribose pyrophosphatase YjhB (NUDIX family)